MPDIFALASAKRFGSTSVAHIDADPSSNSTTLPLTTLETGMNGRARAAANASSIRSCRSSRRFLLRRCHGVLACLSLSNLCHSIVLLTITSRRRSRSMYSKIIGPAMRPRIKNNGVKNPTLFEHALHSQCVQYHLVPGIIRFNRHIMDIPLSTKFFDILSPLFDPRSI